MSTFETTAQKNTDIIKRLFDKDYYKVYIPSDIYSCYDGLVLNTKENKVFIVEVKVRNFDSKFARNSYNFEFMLEKEKYDCLNNIANGYGDKYKVEVIYVNVTSDERVFVFDITGKEYNWFAKTMPSTTCGNGFYKEKLITLLPIEQVNYVIHYK